MKTLNSSSNSIEALRLFALKQKFNEDATTILDICLATPNPDNAVAMLLGIYEKPILPETFTIDGVVRTIIRVDPLANEDYAVYYTYRERNSKYLFYTGKFNEVSRELAEALSCEEGQKAIDQGFFNADDGVLTLNSGKVSFKKFEENLNNRLFKFGTEEVGKSSCSIGTVLKNS